MWCSSRLDAESSEDGSDCSASDDDGFEEPPTRANLRPPMLERRRTAAWFDPESDEDMDPRLAVRRSNGFKHVHTNGDVDSDAETDEEFLEMHDSSSADAYVGGGGGILGIPKASESACYLKALLGHLPAGSPPKHEDLRRYIRSGDVLNMVGGNKWGHCVMILTMDVFDVPVLFDLQPKPSGKEQTQRISSPVPLQRGVSVYVMEIIQSASNLNAIATTSIAVVVHPDTKDVCMVNPCLRGVQLCTGCDNLPVVAEIWMSPFSLQTFDVQLFCKALKEATSPVNTKWSKATAVRSYLRKAALRLSKYSSEARMRRLGESLQESWKARPICSTVPPRVWQKYLHLRSLEREPEELPTESGQGDEMFRGEGAGAPFLYCGRQGVVRADDSPREGCRVCWAGEDDMCGPTGGKQCRACLECQWEKQSDNPDPEVAWVEDVLRMVPLRDDRVLPDELCTVLHATGLWTHLDLRMRPPKHRRHDIDL